MINKFGYQNLLISFLLIYFVYLTVDYNWWENFTISKIDYLIIVISFFSILLRKYFLYVYIVLFLIFLVNAGFSIALLSNFILFFCSYILGYFFLNLIKIKDNYLFSLFTLVTGLGLISLIINILSFFKINYVSTYLIAFLIPSLALSIYYQKKIKEKLLYILELNKNDRPFSPIQIFFIVSISCYLIFVSIIPESSHDGLSTHLAIPNMMSYSNVFHYDFENYVWAVQPSGAQWLFTFLYFIGGETSVKLFTPLICFFLVLYIFEFLKNYQNIDKETSFYISMLFLSLPLTYELVRNLHVEIFHSLVIFSIIFSLLSKYKNWILISIFTGIAFSIKSSTILITPILLFCFLSEKNNRTINRALINLAFVFLFGSLPYFVAFIKTGSPTFPLYNEIFRSDFISKSAFYHPTYSKQSLKDFFLTSFNSKKYGAFSSNGAISLFFPIFFSIIFLYFYKLRRNLLTYLLFGILMSVTIMFIFQSLLRYVYFLIPSLILILSLITNDMINNKKFYNLILIICIFLGIAKYDKTFVQIPNNLNLFIKKEKMIEFDKKHQPLKYLGKKINQDMNYKDKKIFILSNIDTPKFASFDMKVSFWTWHSLKIYMELIKSGNLEKTLNKLEYDYLIYTKNYNVEEKSHIFKGDPRKIGKKIDESHGYVIHLLN